MNVEPPHFTNLSQKSIALAVDEKIIDLALASEFKYFEDAIQYYVSVENNVTVSGGAVHILSNKQLGTTFKLFVGNYKLTKTFISIALY